MTSEEGIRNRMHSLKQAIESDNEKAGLDHLFALAADVLVNLNRIANALEKLAGRG